MIVGVGHKARRGKGAIGSWLQTQFGFVERNFSAALYTECREMFDMEGKDAELLQRWGEARRGPDENYWVDRLDRWYRKSLPAGRGMVVTDVRYPNEVEWIRDHGGEVWRVDRDEPLEAIGRDANHRSETALDEYDGWDRIIDNNGTLAELSCLLYESCKGYPGALAC
jgi:hypothetical protein